MKHIKLSKEQLNTQLINNINPKQLVNYELDTEKYLSLINKDHTTQMAFRISHNNNVKLAFMYEDTPDIVIESDVTTYQGSIVIELKVSLIKALELKKQNIKKVDLKYYFFCEETGKIYTLNRIINIL